MTPTNELLNAWGDWSHEGGWHWILADMGWSDGDLDALYDWLDGYDMGRSDSRRMKRPNDTDLPKTHKNAPESKLDAFNVRLEAAREVPLSSIIEAGRRPCPLHEGDSNNFKVDKFGYCFVCNEKIDAIGWLMKFDGLTFRESVARLAP